MLGKPEFLKSFPTDNYPKTSNGNIVLGNAIFTGHGKKFRLQAVYETIDGFRTRKLGEIYMSSKNEKWVAELLFTEPNKACATRKHYNIEEKMDTIAFFTKALEKENRA